MLRISGDILTAFSVKLDITEDDFMKMGEDLQNQMIAKEIGGLSQLGREQDLRIDEIALVMPYEVDDPT